LFSVEVVNQQVGKGVPFREAYRDVAEQIKKGTFNPEKQVEHTHEGSIGNLCNDKIREKFARAFDG
jgi:argininosuccinate lyase